jgi:predicted nucleic acid-binding protein
VRIFLDANILFSAAKSAGAVRELLARAQSAGHVLCADTYVVAEAHRNLFAKAPEGLSAFDAMLIRISVARFSPSELPEQLAAELPAKDQPVLAAAVRLRCDALLTGDRRHFGGLYGRVVEGVAVHSPLTLAQALEFVKPD